MLFESAVWRSLNSTDTFENSLLKITHYTFCKWNSLYNIIDQVEFSFNSNMSNSDPTCVIRDTLSMKLHLRMEWNETFQTHCDPFATKKFLNLSLEMLVD